MNKIISKLILIASLILFPNLCAITNLFWLGEKDGKIVVIFGDRHVSGYQDYYDDWETLYRLDSTMCAPALINFLKKLSENTENVNLVLELSKDKKDHATDKLDYETDPSNKDSLYTLCHFAITNNYKLKNLTFINSDLRPSFIYDKVVKSFDKLSIFKKDNILTKITFSEFINILRNIKAELLDDIYEDILPSVTSEERRRLKKYINEINDSFNDLVQNDLIRFVKAYFGIKDINLSLFLRLLNMPFQNMRWDKIPVDPAREQLLEIANGNETVVKTLFHNLKNANLNTNKIFLSAFTIFFDRLTDLGFLKDIIQSIKTTKITVGYFGSSHSKKLIKILKQNGFNTLKEVRSTKNNNGIDIDILNNLLDSIINDYVVSGSSSSSPSTLSSSSSSSSIATTTTPSTTTSTAFMMAAVLTMPTTTMTSTPTAISTAATSEESKIAIEAGKIDDYDADGDDYASSNRPKPKKIKKKHKKRTVIENEDETESVNKSKRARFTVTLPSSSSSSSTATSASVSTSTSPSTSTSTTITASTASTTLL